MDWIKKNTVLLVSIVVALAAIGGAGYYLMNKMGESADIGARYTTAVQRRDSLLNKRPNHPGFEKVDNIKIAKEDFDRLSAFESELVRAFQSTVPGEPTERGFKRSLAAILDEIENEGDRSGLTIPTNFNLSFTAQKISYKFASNSLDRLSIQLADLSAVAKILVDARVNSIETFKRIAVSDDDTDGDAVPEEYLKNFTITTNEETKAIIYPYEVSFRCFSEELGDVLEGIALSPYSILVKTIAVEPATIRSSVPKLASAASMYDLGGPPGGFDPAAAAASDAQKRGGKDGKMTSTYGGGSRGRGRGDAKMNSVYGGGGGRGRSGANQPPGAYPPGFAPSQFRPAGPELLLQPEPIRVSLGLAVVHMPEPDAEDSAK